MAALENSILFNEVRAIASTGAKPVRSQFECTLHANGKNIATYYVEEVHIHRDYVKGAYSDVTTVRFTMAAGVYNFDVVPYKDKLELTLTRIMLEEVGAIKNTDLPRQSFRFRAQLYDNKSSTVEGNDPVSVSKEKGDNLTVKTVNVQLINPVVEKLRMMTVGGVFRASTPAELIRGVLGHYSAKAGKDVNVAVKGVDIAPNSNQEVREHYVIPHSTKLVDFPAYIQEICGGVYGGGFGYYLQDGVWYLYPPYDVTRFHKTRKTLTVINIPANRLPAPERSYRVTGGQTILLATGDVKHFDNSEQRQLNVGNGVRFVDSRKVMNGFIVVGDNKAIADRSQNVNEVVVEDRATKLNNVQESENRITSNFLLEYGKLAERAGAYIQFMWENSNDSLLYPGMPVRYMFIQNDMPQEMYGSVVGVETTHVCNSAGPTNRQFTSLTAVTLFVNRKVSFVDKM